MIIRNAYIERISLYRDKELIKVITGIRRCGKSVLMQQYIDNLKNDGVDEKNIIIINFEDKENENLLNKDELYKFLVDKYLHIQNGVLYIFLDEIQKVIDFQVVIDSLYIKPNIDIYLTGSNADLLSAELATLLTGRYIEFHILPLSYNEFLTNRVDAIDTFNSYIVNGGMPYLLNLETEEMKYTYLSGLYNTIINNDIVKRHNDIDLVIFENIFFYLCDNISNITSSNNIANTLTSMGKKVTYNTVEKYIRYMKECFLIYECKRFNLVGKQNLKTLSKFYLVDLGFEKLASMKDSANIGRNIENIVYLELIRRGYKVNVGKLYNLEIDFIAEYNGLKEYIQVCTSLYDEAIREREIKSLLKVRDNYNKTIVTLDEYGIGIVEGINILNLRNWLIQKER